MVNQNRETILKTNLLVYLGKSLSTFHRSTYFKLQELTLKERRRISLLTICYLLKLYCVALESGESTIIWEKLLSCSTDMLWILEYATITYWFDLNYNLLQSEVYLTNLCWRSTECPGWRGDRQSGMHFICIDDTKSLFLKGRYVIISGKVM